MMIREKSIENHWKSRNCLNWVDREAEIGGREMDGIGVQQTGVQPVRAQRQRRGALFVRSDVGLPQDARHRSCGRARRTLESFATHGLHAHRRFRHHRFPRRFPLRYPYVTLRYLTLPYVTLRYLTLPYVTLRYLTLPYVTLRYLTLHYATLRYLTLPYVTLPYVTLGYVRWG